MNAKVKLVLLLGVFFIGLVLGAVILSATSFFQKTTTSATSKQEILVEDPVSAVSFAMYAEYTLEDMMDQADAIFIGEVATISTPRWNQDSGEYWEGEGAAAMQLHQLEILISQSLVDTLGLGEKVTITILGINPVRMEDYTIDFTRGSPHGLEVGNQGVFFVISSEFPWRDGKRPIIGFLGNPQEGYLLLGADGLYHSALVPDGISLNELTRQITESRQ